MTRQTSIPLEKTVVSSLSLWVSLPGCKSLKEKRGRLARLQNQLRKEFNLSVSEIGFMDSWQTALIACAVISNDLRYNQQLLTTVISYLETHFPDEPVADHQFELQHFS